MFFILIDMIAKLFNENIEKLRPVAQTWVSATQENEFGLTVNVDSHLADLEKLTENISSTLIALYEKEVPVGYLGLKIFTNPLGREKIASEHYWYVLPEKRTTGSIKLLRTAKMWAKLNGCSQIIFNASRLASGMHDKVCAFYEKLGCKKFETSYIQEI